MQVIYVHLEGWGGGRHKAGCPVPGVGLRLAQVGALRAGLACTVVGGEPPSWLHPLLLTGRVLAWGVGAA